MKSTNGLIEQWLANVSNSNSIPLNITYSNTKYSIAIAPNQNGYHVACFAIDESHIKINCGYGDNRTTVIIKGY